MAADSIIDIDAGTVERIGGLPEVDGSELTPPISEPFYAERAGSNALIRCLRGCQDPDLFVLLRVAP